MNEGGSGSLSAPSPLILFEFLKSSKLLSMTVAVMWYLAGWEYETVPELSNGTIFNDFE